MQPTKEFYARIPASLAKDCKLSPTAKLLYVLLAVHADSRTGVMFVGFRTLERLLGCAFQHCGEGEPCISSHSQFSPSQEAVSAVP